MPQFKIELQKLSDTGSSLPEYETHYADNHEQARILFNQYNRMNHENGRKMWRVTLHVLCYKNIESPTDFLAQFQA